MDERIGLRACVERAAVNGALERDTRVGVDDLLVDHLVVGDDLYLICLRVDRGHVMKEGRLLHEPLLTVFATVGEILLVPLHVVVHGVLASKTLPAPLLLADELTVVVLHVFHSHRYDF